MRNPYCNDTRPCVFNHSGRCSILETAAFPDGECSFAKPSRDAKPYNIRPYERRPEPDNRQWWEKFPYYLECKS